MKKILFALTALIFSAPIAAAMVSSAASCDFMDTGNDAFQIFFLEDSAEISVKIHEVTDWRNNQHTLHTYNFRGGALIYDVTDLPEVGGSSGVARSFDRSPTRYDLTYYDMDNDPWALAMDRQDGVATKRMADGGGIGINYRCEPLSIPGLDELLMEHVDRLNEQSEQNYREKEAEYKREAESAQF